MRDTFAAEGRSYRLSTFLRQNFLDLSLQEAIIVRISSVSPAGNHRLQ